MNKFILNFLTASMVCGFAQINVFAEEPQTPEEEAVVVAAEEEEAAKLDVEIRSPLNGIGVSGTYVSQQTGDEKPAVSGFLKIKERTYLIKPNDDDVRQALQKLNGKVVNLFGKERNKGKYFIVLSILPNEEGPPSRRKKKGF